LKSESAPKTIPSSPEFHFVAIRTDLQRELTAIYRAAIAAVDPALLVGRALDGATSASREVSDLIAAADRSFVLAIGKGSHPMASELQRRLGAKIVRSLAVVPRAPQGQGTPPGIQGLRGGHPLPDQSSADAARAALDMLGEMKAGDLLIVALSGGASAMFVAPAPGVTLDDKVATNAALLRSGATIKELNCVRKHLSAVKGGNLVRATAAGAPRDDWFRTHSARPFHLFGRDRDSETSPNLGSRTRASSRTPGKRRGRRNSRDSQKRRPDICAGQESAGRQ
jgi:hypothetical protein